MQLYTFLDGINGIQPALPIQEMIGRPRVDVLCNMSGIFRDSDCGLVTILVVVVKNVVDNSFNLHC